MAHSSIFNIAEVFYGAPKLWKCIKLKGNDSHRSRLKKFIKLECRKQKPVYSSNLTHLKISYYHPLSDKKINSIVRLFPNIIHLDFDYSTGFSDKALKWIAE